MAERDLDALVVRAPDNVLYLTNFWGMKGYDAVVFPREGEPVLICLEASEADAARTAWTPDVRLSRGTRGDPRPPRARARPRAADRRARYDRVGIELSLGRRRRTAWSGSRRPHEGVVRRVPGRGDATPLLAEARAIKTEQEIERMRLANEIAAAAMEHSSS